MAGYQGRAPLGARWRGTALQRLASLVVKDGGTNCEAAQALQRQTTSTIYYTGKNPHNLKHGSTGWAQRYARTDGFLPKPPSQISYYNDETILKQNPGWYDSDTDWNMSGTPAY
jgi:hypothetical protein